MITLTTDITIANDISKIHKWQVVDVHDYAGQTPPYLMVTVTLFGAGGVAFGSYTLCIYDAIASTVLQVNPSPQQVNDQSGNGRSLTLNGASQLFLGPPLPTSYNNLLMTSTFGT